MNSIFYKYIFGIICAVFSLFSYIDRKNMVANLQTQLPLALEEIQDLKQEVVTLQSKIERHFFPNEINLQENQSSIHEIISAHQDHALQWDQARA